MISSEGTLKPDESKLNQFDRLIENALVMWGNEINDYINRNVQ